MARGGMAMIAAAIAAMVATAAALPQHVLVIGIDGLGGDWFYEADAPNLQALARDGTSTVVMQDVLGTSSSQNWMSMIVGSGPDQHGVYTNGWERGDSNPPPTMFALTRDARGTSARIGCVYHWSGFGRLVEDDAPDLKESPGNERRTTEAAVEYILQGAPDLMFVHLDNVDAGGHSSYWGSPQYFASIAVADGLVGDLLDAYAQVGALANTTILVSSDHGGDDNGGHGDDRSPLRNIPFIVSGAGINRGVVVDREVRVFDLAATAAYLLDVPTPATWIATPVFEAFEGFVPPPPPRGPLVSVLTTNYTFVYDNSGEDGTANDHSVWRPVAPPGYVSLGDVAVQGRNRPTFATPVFLDDADASGISAVAQPAAFERIWTNTDFGEFDNPVTYWQPIPRYGYTCVGTWAANSGPSATEPARSVLRCVNSAYVSRAPIGDVSLIARNSGDSSLESGSTGSLWEAERAADVVSANSFIVRRDQDGPGYNKFFYITA